MRKIIQEGVATRGGTRASCWRTVSAALALCAGAVVAAGCGDGGGNGGVVTSNLVPCDEDFADLYSFSVTPANPAVRAEISIFADTIEESTAADLAFSGVCVDADDFIVGSFSGDDELDCTFPPPDFSCPAVDFLAPSTAVSCILAMTVASSRCEDPDQADYRLTVTVDNVGPNIRSEGNDVERGDLREEEAARYPNPADSTKTGDQ